MRKYLLLGIAVTVAAIVIVYGIAATKPEPELPANIMLFGLDRSTAAALLATQQELDQTYADGDFATFRRLLSDSMFAHIHNTEAQFGRALDHSSFKPSPRPKRGDANFIDEGELTAAGRVGDTAALFYVFPLKKPNEGASVHIKRFVWQRDAWAMDSTVQTFISKIPSEPEQLLELTKDKPWDIDGQVHSPDPLLAPVAYPTQVALNSDALVTVKLNGKVVAQTKEKEFEEFLGMWSIIYTLNHELKKGENTIAIESQPYHPAATAHGTTQTTTRATTRNANRPYGLDVKVIYFPSPKEKVELYRKKLPATQPVSIHETFQLAPTTMPSPIACQSCKQSSQP